MKNTVRNTLAGLVCLAILSASHFMCYQYGTEEGTLATEVIREELRSEVKASLREHYAKNTAQSIVEAKAVAPLPEFNQDFLFSVVIDNDHDGFSSEGPWIEGKKSGEHYGKDYLANRDIPSKATWKTVVPPSRYKVYVTWVPSQMRTTNAVYKVNGTPVRVNQRLANKWHLLGEFDLDGLVTIELEGVRICADAIGITNYPQNAK